MRKIWLLAVPAVLVLASVGFLFARGEPTWSTDSPEALSAFEQCLEEDMKVYNREAIVHCKRAIELDPDFAAAKLQLARLLWETKDREELLAELRETDLSRLSPRERFLIRYRLARSDGRDEEASRILEQYLDERPDDPFALESKCMEAWARQDWSTAEPCYQRLLEVDPNWVRAQNNLGYIAIAQGRFDEAEEHFKIYRFIAPDQANPHDSLGELLMLIGRYDEAEAALREALRIREDFCPPYEHLIRLFLLADRIDQADQVLKEAVAKGVCGAGTMEYLSCSVALWEAEDRRDWDTVWRLAMNECRFLEGDALVIAHKAAVRSGRAEEARELEGRIEKHLEEDLPPMRRQVDQALLSYMQGTRLAAAGDDRAAIEKFRLADGNLRYWDNTGLGIFKLFNRLSWVRALHRLGEDEEAEKIIEWIRDVNPQFVEDYATRTGSAAAKKAAPGTIGG